MEFTVTRTGDTEDDLTVVYNVHEPEHPNPTGNPNSSGRRRTVTIPAGSSSAAFDVIAHNDGVAETYANDRLLVRILPSDDYQLVGTTETYLNIDDPLSEVSLSTDADSRRRGRDRWTFTADPQAHGP